MAQIEQLDVENDFEDKENLLQHSNVLPRTPCPEKGYEELDVSELSMKLRYSITPASSPMSKSYTANCRDNKHYEAIDDSKNVSAFYSNNLTHSMNSALKINESLPSKACPLQPLPTDLQNPIHRSTDINPVDTAITFRFSGNHSEEDSLLSSPSASANLTPEATTPTKEIIKDGGSPILRGLKSVFSMFRSSQSPIPPAEVTATSHTLSPTTEATTVRDSIPQPSLISTPISKTKESSSKRNSPLKESLTFKDDLEKELLWKDESTILFKDEKIPIHKLFLQQPLSMPTPNNVIDAGNNMSVEYMDISQNDSTMLDATMTDLDAGVVKHLTDIINHVESDSEFVDCETTFTKNDSLMSNLGDELMNDSLKMVETEQQNKEQTNSCNISETNQVINEIMALNHDSTMEVIKNIDSSIEMLKANKLGDSQQTDTDIKDHMSDLVNVPIALCPQSTDVTGCSNFIGKVDTSSQKNYTFECLSETIDSLINETLSTSTQKDNNEKDTDINVNFKDLKYTKVSNNSFRESFNNVSDTFVREYEAMDISEDNSKIIADLSTVVDETYEIIAKDNGDVSNLDNKQEQNDCLSEQAVVDKVDVKVSIPNTNDNLAPDSIITDSNRMCDTELAKLYTQDKEKQETNINNVESVKVASENDTTYEKEEVLHLEENKQRQLSHETVDSNNTDISNLCNPPCNLEESNKLAVEKDTIILNANIPFPCGTDTEQKLITEYKNVVSDSETKLYDSDTTNLKCTEFQADHVKDELEVNTSIDQNMSETKQCDIDNAFVNTVIEYISNETQISKCKTLSNQETQISNCKTLSNQPDAVDDKLDICDHSIVESAPNFVSQFTNENTFDIENTKITIDSLNVKVCVNESSNNVLNDNGHNNITENINNSISISTDNNPGICSVTSNDVVQNDQVKLEYDEEIITSASSSPYVSVTDMAVTSLAQDKDNLTSLAQDKDNLDDIENPFETKSKIDKSPPISPQPKKGYNFNFDDIEDPFATKTKIRLSPTPESPKSQLFTPSHESKKSNDIRRKDFHKNKRKTQTEKAKKCFTNTPNTNKNNSNKIPVDQKDKDKDKNFKENESIYQKDNDKDKNLKEDESINDGTLSKETNEKNSKELNDYDNTEVTLRKITSYSTADECDLKKIDDTEALCNTPKTQDISLLQEEIVIEKTSVPKSYNIEVFDNTTTFVPELKENEYNNELYNNSTTSNASLFKEEMTTEEIESVHQIDYTFKNVNFGSESNVRNVIDATVDFAKTLAPSLAIENSISEVTENDNYCKDNDAVKSKPTVTPPPIACEVSSDGTQEVNSYTELEQHAEECISASHEDSISDFNNATCVLKNTDANHTLTEVNTEDEDTIEGPFLETDGFANQQNVRHFGSDSNMMQFDFPSAVENDDNIDNGELFIDAEAFEFLLNQNKTNVITNSGKESLFLKFDPLYSKRISSGDVLTALSKIQQGHSTPIKVTKATNEDLQTEAVQPSSSKIGPSSEDCSEDADISSMPKPMMVVNPAVNPIISPRKVTPNKINRQSLTFTSPAIAVIDRLLCLSGNTSLLDQNESFLPREHNDTDIAITQLRELLAEKEIHVHNLRSESKELKDRLANLETQMKTLEAEGEKRLKKVNDLNERLAEKTKINRSMAVVVEEYERTIASLITEMEQEKKRNAEERNILIKERDEQTSHLASMEVSFNDLHSKYEKSKQIILSMKANEDTYKKSIRDFEENLVKMQNNYELLKQHATSKLNHANQELEKFNKAHESEVLKLNAMIKRKEMHITSLEETLAQKSKANEELASICDELINKVG